jgi:polyisoprenoid-binding protein YceI
LRQTLAAFGFAAAVLVASVAQAQPAPLTQNPAEVHAGAFSADPRHSKITWSVSHFGFHTYVGQFSSFTGSLTLDPKAPQSAQLSVTIDTNTLGTLNPALDTHLKSADFLDVAKFPEASFKATSVKRTGDKTADITGDLTLHGVTRPVVVQATFNQAGTAPTDRKYTVGFSGKAVVKRSDFGIKTYVPAIGDDVTLQIETEFKAAS